MEQISPNWWLIFLGLLAILSELFIGVQTGFDLILLGTSLLIGGIIGNWQNSWQIGLTTSAILSLAYIVLGRKFLKDKLAITTHNTNIDNLVGKVAHVVKEINRGHAGQIKIGSEIWRAEGEETITRGEKVKVVSLEGVTLKVVKSN